MAAKAIEQMASNPTLTVLARVAMFLTPVLVSIGLFILGNWLEANTRVLDRMADRIAVGETMVGSLANRVSTIETRINVIGPSRDEFQRQTQLAIRDLTSTLSLLSTDIATTKRDVGYLRSWVEEIKREAREAVLP